MFSVCVGALLAFPLSLWWDGKLQQAQQRDEAWAESQEYKRLPPACFGGPAFTIGLFWIGWSARSGIHWIVPVLSGIPIGLGFVLIFIGLANYLVDAYRIYAASALGISSITRSGFGVVLPLATTKMYNTLGIHWGCSLLGFVSLLMCLIPFVFIRFGPKIMANSPMCQELIAQQRCADNLSHPDPQTEQA